MTAATGSKTTSHVSAGNLTASDLRALVNLFTKCANVTHTR